MTPQENLNVGLDDCRSGLKILSGRHYTITVQQKRVEVELKDRFGRALSYAPFALVHVRTGQRWTGVLDKRGKATVEGVTPGPLKVRWGVHAARA